MLLKKKKYLKSIFVLYVFLLLVIYPSVYAETKSRPSLIQKGANSIEVTAVVINPRFEFSPVIDGKIVTHTFIVENRGTSVLSILDVKTGCGCTTADYSKRIEPGEKGQVTINGNTTGYGGRAFSKTVTVFTNDPKNPKLTLFISGPVEKAVTIVPKKVRLSGLLGTEISAILKIIPEKKYAFQITGIKSGKEKYFSYNLKEIKKLGRSEYVLTVNNISTESGRYFDKIMIETDSAVIPDIKIKVFGNIKSKAKEKALSTES